ncbi:MAG: hypothetical protein U0X40_04260 [Ferruginibacter sp.]
MKKVYLVASLLLGFFVAQSQDIDDIRKMIYLKQFDKARTELDKYLANPSNAAKSDGWYYKGFLYGALSRDANVSPAESNKLSKEAFEAIKKYRELDPKQKLTTEEENNSLYNIYYTFYDLGIKTYGTKDMEQSYKNFQDALTVHDYIYSNKLKGPKAISFAALDTDVVFNLLVVGAELNKTDELVPYYKRIIDSKLSDRKYLNAYETLVLYYKTAKNQAAFDEYLAKGKEVFPTEDFWEAADIENATDGLKGEALFKKFDELSGRYPNSYTVFFNYAYELNNYVGADESKADPNLAAYRQKIPELFKKAIAIKSTVEANMVLANFFYNNSYDLSEEARKIKGTKPDDVKKRNDLNAASKASSNSVVPYAQEAVKQYAAMTKLRTTDKVNYKLALEMLSNVAKLNGDAKKAAEYEQQRLAVDKL